MEDVLDVYCQPYDPAVPRICMDEMGKNLVKDKLREKTTPTRKKAARTSSLPMNPSLASGCVIRDRTANQEGLGTLHARGA
jgi:hypothetical protein